MTENQQTERQLLQRHTHAQSTMLTSTLLLGYSRFPVARLVFPRRIVHHNMTCPWPWRRTRSYIHFRLPPLVVPPWPVLTVCDHGQGVALPNRLSHTASSFFTRHPHSWSCAVPTHTACLPPRRARSWAPRASRCTCGFLSPPLNLDQCARGWSTAHVSKASYIEAVHELHQHLLPFACEMLLCPSQTSLFPTGSSPPSACCCGPPPGATSTESRCALPCPSPFCLFRTVLHWVNVQLNRNDSTQVFGKRLNPHRLCWCTIASVQFCFSGAGGDNALLLRPGLDQVLPVQDHAPADRLSWLSVSCTIRVSKGVQGTWMSLPFKQTPNPLPSNEKPSHSLHVLQVLYVRPRHLWAQLHGGEHDQFWWTGKSYEKFC